MLFKKGMRVRLREEYTTSEGMHRAADMSCFSCDGMEVVFGPDYLGTITVLETPSGTQDHRIIVKMGDSRCWIHKNCLESCDAPEPEETPEWAARWSKMMEA
jgi:hypothetical protein